MTLLVISPDYASHAIPLITIASAWKERGQRVVVASGPSVRPLVAKAGLEPIELIMSRGSNPGVIIAAELDRAEARSLDGFFEATRRGMLETLRYQALARSVDLLWHPEQVARRTIAIVEAVQPDTIIVDHLAFASTIGLHAIEIPYADVVLGHPTALPVGNEVYGVPRDWPPTFRAEPVELESLRMTAREVSKAFTVAYDAALRSVEPSATSVDDAFAAHGEVVLYNYPEQLHPKLRTRCLPAHAFLGSSVRAELPDDETATWLAASDDRPLVLVSFGTFLSRRADVLARVAAALGRVEVRVAFATGDNDRTDIGPVGDDWLIRAHLPQVALLREASLFVTHGGNNSITEAMAAGVPVVCMPFSTDQFDGAAAIEQHIAGAALDPNKASRSLITSTIRGLLRNPPTTPREIAQQQRRAGPAIAYDRLERARKPPGPRAIGALQSVAEARPPG